MKKCIVLCQLHVLHTYSIKVLLVVPHMYVTNLHVLLICYVSHFIHHMHAHYNNNYSVAIVPHRGVGTVFVLQPYFVLDCTERDVLIIATNENLKFANMSDITHNDVIV